MTAHQLRQSSDAAPERWTLVGQFHDTITGEWIGMIRGRELGPDETVEVMPYVEPRICPRCKNGNGTVWDGGGSRVDCPSCNGEGTWEGFLRRREFVKGYNAALESVRLSVRPQEMP